MDTSADGSPGSPSGYSARPSGARRSAAVVSLLATLVLACAVVVMLAKHPLSLVLGLVGLALMAGGGWWMVTERNVRRGLGIAGLAAGALVLAIAVVGTAAHVDAAAWRLLLLVALGVLATGCARIALVPDLHELDRRQE